MRVLTPEVDDLLDWFERTHELTATVGAAWWSLARLPHEGAVGAQDARLMAALDYIRELQDAELRRRTKKSDPDTERRAFHEQTIVEHEGQIGG